MNTFISQIRLKQLLRILLATLLLFFLIPFLWGQSSSKGTNEGIVDGKDNIEQEIKILRNLRYGDKPTAPYTSDTSSDRLLDLYLPVGTNANNKPVFVFIHGGGFSGGDKSALASLSRTLASKGFAVISTNYRLYLKHNKISGASARANMSKGLRANGKFHPAMQQAVHTATEDITQVLAWLKETQSEYSFDLDRVTVAGGSAGAMAALHLAYASGQNILPLQAVVNLWGGLQDASVIQKDAPPLLTFHGDQDELIHIDYAYALDSRMKEVGSVSEMHILEGKGHALYKLISADYTDTIVSFLSNLKGKDLH